MGNAVDMNRIVSYKQMNDALGNYFGQDCRKQHVLKKQ